MGTKDQETFRLHLVGKTVRPESVSLGRLTECLRAVQRLIGSSEADADLLDEDRDENDSDLPLHLLDVQRGSAVYPVFASDAEAVMTRLQLVARAIEEPEVIAPYPGMVKAVDELSELGRKLNCRVEFRGPTTENRPIIATIRPDTFDGLRESLYLTGPTSLTATVERAGGKVNRHCGLRLPNQDRRQLTCKVVSDELVRRLGQAMYQTVTVHGRATWYRYDWSITGMVIESMEPFEPVKPTGLLAELRSAAGDSWSKVDDPQALVRELRG